MNKSFFLALIFIAAFLQVAAVNYFKVFNIQPDLLLILAVMAGIVFKFRWAVFFSGFAGVLKDAFSLNAAGINTALFVLWGFLIIKLSRKVSLGNYYFCAALVFIVSLFQGIITAAIFAFLGKFIPLGISLRIILLDSLYTALVSFLVFKLIKPVIN